MPEGDEITIPEDVRVRCPLRQFALRRATHCEQCQHFAGLTELLAGQSVPFARRYSVRCAYPIDRELAATVED